MPRAWGSSVLVVLAAIAAVGCAPALPPLTAGGATPRPTTAAPVQLERAAPTATAPVALDGPIGPTGLFEPAAWPRACAVLDDTGLRTVLPGTGRIARKPRAGEMTVFGVGRASTVQVPEASCDIGVELPDKDFDPAGGYNEYALTVEIRIAGTPEMVAQNRRDPSGDERPTVLDGTSCLSRSSAQELTCTTSRVEFSVRRGSIGIPNPIDREAVIRYVHDGRTEVFRRDGGVPEVERRNRYETEVVLPEFARVILRNLGS
ncbi:hypothetical protein FHX44_111156 [Pseudonocardia hierapolitana]|uniref:Uncharacterized protein n=1 Tax=Pseudonocardia hierapolitana TaxID=1128676 RepID=A0A561SKD7_9PSEU|nr:hypothetical protein [Pseudonocardia hierapolitana]TWF75272.1 hypothetical protein FHX44_111156 [Pseudonocardia hierapolitana]